MYTNIYLYRNYRIKGFSDYHPNHPIYDKTNQKALGKFKDELNGNIASFSGPKPKSYFYREEKERKKKQRFKKTSSEYCQYKKYEETLNRELKGKVAYNSLRCKDHQIFVLKQSKFAVSNNDDQTYGLNDCESLPYGHYLIKASMIG